MMGCYGPGAPRITITKDIHIINSCDIDVLYRTESSTTSTAEIAQDLKDLLDLTVKPKP